MALAYRPFEEIEFTRRCEAAFFAGWRSAQEMFSRVPDRVCVLDLRRWVFAGAVDGVIETRHAIFLAEDRAGDHVRSAASLLGWYRKSGPADPGEILADLSQQTASESSNTSFGDINISLE